jgi:hypothetical protein
MSHVSDRWDFYRKHGLDVAGDTARGPLTPELARALSRLMDLLTVNEVMEGKPIRITLEVPPELDQSLQDALKGP